MVEIHFWIKHSDENNKKLSSGIDSGLIGTDRVIGRPGTGQHPKTCNSN